MSQLRWECDIAVVGSGFAGTIAARVLSKLGFRVLLLERGTHPRFALGESSTPLAAIALESLAERYALSDLKAFAAYGRWMERFSEVERGLKRGFTFWGHRPGSSAGKVAAHRLLVAASPHDAVADTHWLRSDVDSFLVDRARAEGVEYQSRVELDAFVPGQRVRLRGQRDGQPLTIDASFVVDASGGRGFLARAVPIPPQPGPPPVDAALVFGHFEGVRDFAAVLAEEGVKLAPGPYRDDRAAVHHLLDLGWMYVLTFDSGVVSAGFLLDHAQPASGKLEAASSGEPERLWQSLLERYPMIGRQFEAAKPLFPLRYQRRVRHRLSRAAGERFLLLPSAYAVTDALFSTGIAWSLTGVERLGRMFEKGFPSEEQLLRYETLLIDEADHIESLVAAAYRSLAHFRLFASTSMLYFAAASFGEASRRLKPDERVWCWEGFLGARDPAVKGVLLGAHRRLEVLTEIVKGPLAKSATEAFESWIRAAIEPRNIAGLADPRRGNLYPVDFEPLIAGAEKLGMSAEEVRAALPGLPSFSSSKAVVSCPTA